MAPGIHINKGFTEQRSSGLHGLHKGVQSSSKKYVLRWIKEFTAPQYRSAQHNTRSTWPCSGEKSISASTRLYKRWEAFGYATERRALMSTVRGEAHGSTKDEKHSAMLYRGEHSAPQKRGEALVSTKDEKN
jgi:hypothetical protein